MPKILLIQIFVKKSYTKIWGFNETEHKLAMRMRSRNKNKKGVPLRALKTFIRKKMGHTT